MRLIDFEQLSDVWAKTGKRQVTTLFYKEIVSQQEHDTLAFGYNSKIWFHDGKCYSMFIYYIQWCFVENIGDNALVELLITSMIYERLHREM